MGHYESPIMPFGIQKDNTSADNPALFIKSARICPYNSFAAVNSMPCLPESPVAAKPLIPNVI